MARTPRAVEAAELVAEAGWSFYRGPHGCGVAFSDPAVGGVEHTVFFMQLDKPVQSMAMAAKLEGEAAVLRAAADAHAKMAEVLKSRG
jgi:hypothetical protein